MHSGRNLFFLLTGFAAVSGLLLGNFLEPSETESIPAPPVLARGPTTASPVPAAISSAPLTPPEVLQEAINVGQVDPNPEATENRLDEISRGLDSTELNDLVEVAKSPSGPGDLRSVAVDLLARYPGEEVLVPLEEIIFTKNPEARDARLKDFELALRARAIEGLQNHPSDKATWALGRVAETVDEPFLMDRGRRAFLYRQGKVPALEDQDRDAQERLLRR